MHVCTAVPKASRLPVLSSRERAECFLLPVRELSCQVSSLAYSCWYAEKRLFDVELPQDYCGTIFKISIRRGLLSWYFNPFFFRINSKNYHGARKYFSPKMASKNCPLSGDQGNMILMSHECRRQKMFKNEHMSINGLIIKFKVSAQENFWEII